MMIAIQNIPTFLYLVYHNFDSSLITIDEVSTCDISTVKWMHQLLQFLRQTLLSLGTFQVVKPL